MYLTANVTSLLENAYAERNLEVKIAQNSSGQMMFFALTIALEMENVTCTWEFANVLKGF
jgi:hypothetical protein